MPLQVDQKMKKLPIKNSNSLSAVKIVLVCCLIGLIAFGWLVRPAFDVIANGETWLSSDCHRVRNGFSTLLMAATNPKDEATQEMRAGQSRLMPSIFLTWPRFSGKYSTNTPHGLECRSPVDIREPFGNPPFGDMLENKCAQFNLTVQSCLAEAYNHYIHIDPGFPVKESCTWTIVPPRSACAKVEASWKPAANANIGE